jgi:hypothetical protein
MERGQFFVPVSLVVEGHLHDLKNAKEALSFLKAWPPERRGPVYGCAINSCEAALAGKLSLEQARQAVASFAKITGILAQSPTTPPLRVRGADPTRAPSSAHSSTRYQSTREQSADRARDA